MKLSRRRVLHLAAGAAALPGISRIASAQAYPARPVTIVVPFAAGGSTDVSARIVGEYMARTLGPDRFARDLSVQITGHDYLRSLGVELVPTSAPDFFTTDTPTAVLVRQVLGAVSQFDLRRRTWSPN